MDTSPVTPSIPATSAHSKHDVDYVFYELTRSICPACRRVIDAKIILRDNKVYMNRARRTGMPYTPTPITFTFERHDAPSAAANENAPNARGDGHEHALPTAGHVPIRARARRKRIDAKIDRARQEGVHDG